MDPKNEKTVVALERLLANSYTVYLKTHSYHWNVTGPMFNTLHTLFEQQYTERALAVDEIAERLRSLGARAPGSFAEFSKLTETEEASASATAAEMIGHLAKDQSSLVASASEVLRAAEQANDFATADLGTRRIDVHEKHA